jgi:uncharacterized spore protein YtfJ
LPERIKNMSTKINELLTSIISQLKEMAVTESIVGKPVTLGDKLVIPVSKISVGFGAGGAEGEIKSDSSKFGGGGGGGARIEPAGFIIFDGKNFAFLPANQSKFGGIIEAIPDIIDKFKGFKKSKDDSTKAGDKKE